MLTELDTQTNPSTESLRGALRQIEQEHRRTPVAVDATATLTAAEVAQGYISTTSAAAVTMTLPTGTLLGAALGATQGTIHELFIDNTAGADVVTVAVATNGVQSSFDLEITAATASVTPAAITPLTIPSGVTGTARFTLVFSSATAYTFTRTA